MNIKPAIIAAVVAITALSFLCCSADENSNRPVAARPMSSKPIVVKAAGETQPMEELGDAADDPAIWVHPIDPAKSLVLATDKKAGLVVYDLDGKVLQNLRVGKLNNVDVRSGIEFGDRKFDVAAAGNRTDDTIALFTVDPLSRRWTPIPGPAIKVGLKAYGSCLFKDRKSGTLYFVINSKKGEVEQWELRGTKSGEMMGTKRRVLKFESQLEGCVADEALGLLYIGEEKVGIWRLSTDPNDHSEPTKIDSADKSGHLIPDVEGLTIYCAEDSKGYLIASSQGSNEYVLYERAPPNRYVGRFQVASPRDEKLLVHDTDGIDVVSTSLGNKFPSGLFVVQDGGLVKKKSHQNFKLVHWSDIASKFQPPLISQPPTQAKAIAK